jgi:hypothetical protein
MNSRIKEYQSRLDRELKVIDTTDFVKIKVASKLCIYESRDRDYTLNVMRNISGFAVGKKKPVHLDLRLCEGITAAAMVMLFAEISRAKLATGFDDIVKLFLPEDDHPLRQMLKNSGWEHAVLIGQEKLQELVDENKLFQSNNNPNESIKAVYEQLTSHGINLDVPEVKRFTKGVSEAMLNVINHAYDNEDEPLSGIGRRWWQACYVKQPSEDRKKMVFIIYDLGQGILSSLPKKSGESPEEHICRAMSYGVTRTGEAKRGKGSKDIEDAAQIRKESILLVGTNNVSYIKWKDGKIYIKEGTLPFCGTIVEWQINL